MRYHVLLNRVLPEAERDKFRALPEEVQASWNPSTGRQDEVGEPTAFTLDMDPDTAEQVDSGSNVEAVVPVVEEEAFPVEAEELEDDIQAASLPTAATRRYHRAPEARRNTDGRGVTFIGGDTGVAEIVSGRFAGPVIRGANYTGEGAANDTRDRHGHGSGTGYMACGTLAGAKFMAHKVLRDNGSGPSSGIEKSFYASGDYARANPSEKVIYVGAFGSDSDALFEPYVRAIKYATDRGVVFVLSAGNGNQHIIGRPANTCRVNPRVVSSIAFDKSNDRRASFSNYHADGTLCAAGVREIGYRHDGKLYYLSGTSFSGPLTAEALGLLAGQHPLTEALAALKSSGRNTPEPTSRQGGGCVNYTAALNKLKPKEATRLYKVQTDAFANRTNAVQELERVKRNYPRAILKEVRQNANGRWVEF